MIYRDPWVTRASRSHELAAARLMRKTTADVYKIPTLIVWRNIRNCDFVCDLTTEFDVSPAAFINFQ